MLSAKEEKILSMLSKHSLSEVAQQFSEDAETIKKIAAVAMEKIKNNYDTCTTHRLKN